MAAPPNGLDEDATGLPDPKIEDPALGAAPKADPPNAEGVEEDERPEMGLGAKGELVLELPKREGVEEPMVAKGDLVEVESWPNLEAAKPAGAGAVEVEVEEEVVVELPGPKRGLEPAAEVAKGEADEVLDQPEEIVAVAVAVAWGC